MIIPIHSNFNLFVSLKHSNLLDLSYDEMLKYISSLIIEDFGEDINHFHGNKRCSKNDISYYSSYDRYLTVLNHDGSREESKICINVYKCSTNDHYHALLPPSIIIPYFIYSLPSILLVLTYSLIEGNSIIDTCEHFDISLSLYYKWLHKFKAAFMRFRSIVLKEFNHQELNDFIKQICDIESLSLLISNSINDNIPSPFRLIKSP